jgi:hypothetical protein
VTWPAAHKTQLPSLPVAAERPMKADNTVLSATA